MSEVIKHYKYLHSIPEYGFEEVKTSAYLAEKLEAAGYKVTRNVGDTTGVVAEYDSGKPGPVFGLIWTRWHMSLMENEHLFIAAVMTGICLCYLQLLKKLCRKSL